MKKIIYSIICVLAISIAGCGNNGMQYAEDVSLEEKETEQDSSKTEASMTAEETNTIQEVSSIFVYVCGAVNQPGVYELSYGARAVQAITAAGGLRENAAADYVNQAKVLEDGEQLLIPTLEEAAAWTNPGQNANQTPASTGGESPSSSGVVNINQASETELRTLNGIGEARAQAIIAYRDEHGGFQSIEEIKKVDGIGDSIYNKIKDSIGI